MTKKNEEPQKPRRDFLGNICEGDEGKDIEQRKREWLKAQLEKLKR
jgi:hypothetical protein